MALCVPTVAVSRFRPLVGGGHRRTVPVLSMAPREACIRLIYIRQTIRSRVLKLLSPRGRLSETRWIRPVHTSRLAAVVIGRYPNSWMSFWGPSGGSREVARFPCSTRRHIRGVRACRITVRACCLSQEVPPASTSARISIAREAE